MRDAFREDLSRLENIQANMASGILIHTPLSDQEIVVRHAYRVIEDIVGSDIPLALAIERGID